MQNQNEIERFYETEDPWGYKTNPEDQKRKEKILEILHAYSRLKPFQKALDLGAGEGWITQDLPALEKYAYELSQTALSRLPRGIHIAEVLTEDYDLVTATGVLYKHYNAPKFFQLMRDQSTHLILTCNIKEMECPEMSVPYFHMHHLRARQDMELEFSYRDYVQKLRVFRKL